MSMSSPIQRGLGIVKSAAAAMLLNVFVLIKPPRPSETTISTTTDGSRMLVWPKGPFDAASVPPQKRPWESGSASILTMQPASSIRSPKVFDEGEWSENLKNAYGIAVAQDFEDMETTP